MKKAILFPTLLIFLSSCEKLVNKANPYSAEGTTVYRLVNTCDEKLNYKYYSEIGDYYGDVNVVFSGIIEGNDTIYFTMDQFSHVNKDNNYFLDWYTDDYMYSEGIGRSETGWFMTNAPYTDTVPMYIGADQPNYIRAILYGPSATPQWYDENNPDDKYYTLYRDGSASYTSGGKEYKCPVQIYSDTSLPERFLRCEFAYFTPESAPEDIKLNIINGDGYSIGYGSPIMIELYQGRETERIFRRR